MAALHIGIDLGGTKIELVALDEAHRILLRRRIATPRLDYAATVAAIVGLVCDAEVELGASASVGVGIPGAISPATGVVKNANSTWINGRPLHRDLAAALGRPVAVANDANCLVLSEAVDGAAVGARVVFGVILGTGCGGGIAIDGRVIVGANAIAGEWGHNPLPWPSAAESPGPECYCGRRGCIETWISGPGVAADHARVTGTTLSTPDIAAAAAAGAPDARGTLDRFEERLGRGLAQVINLLDPDVIVLGGGLSNLPGLCDRVPQRWTEWVFSDRVDTRLVTAQHGDSSGVRGAAWLPGKTWSSTGTA
jgi:fructokinase